MFSVSSMRARKKCESDASIASLSAMIVHRDFRSMPRLAWERLVTEAMEDSFPNWFTVDVDAFPNWFAMDVDAVLQTRLEDLHGPQFDFNNGETWIVDTMKRDYWRDQ